MTFRFKNIAREIGCGSGSVTVSVAARASPCHGRQLANVEGLSDTGRQKKSHQ
jgi:precorrin-6B methylase 2